MKRIIDFDNEELDGGAERCDLNFEHSFLEYSWDLFNSEHAAGRHCDPGTARWPGYLGKYYKAGGILFVGTIHNPNEVVPSRSANAASRMRSLRGLFDEWMKLSREEAMADTTILLQLRESYLCAIRSWIEFPVWQMFDELRRIARVEWEDVAFTNIAKCAGTTAWTLSCAKTFSLNEFVKMLQPSIVLISNDDRFVRRNTAIDSESVSRGETLYVRRFPNSTRPYEGKPSWGDVKEMFRQHFTSTSESGKG